jgi:hypothetical protein
MNPRATMSSGATQIMVVTTANALRPPRTPG